jgi:hypothetical protein
MLAAIVIGGFVLFERLASNPKKLSRPSGQSGRVHMVVEWAASTNTNGMRSAMRAAQCAPSWIAKVWRKRSSGIVMPAA